MMKESTASLPERPSVSVWGWLRQKRQRTLPEELVNAISHGVGAFASIVAVTLLIVMASLETNAKTITAVSIYGGSLFLLFLSSTLYHSIPMPSVKRVLRMLDHCAIYLLIAGSYTPFLLVKLEGWLGWTLFSVVWTLAMVGIVCKLSKNGKYHWLHVTNYIVMGWVGVVASPALLEALSPMTVNMLVAGGLVYTLGVVFYVLDRIPYAHSIWHFFVLGGSVCHYIAIYNDMLV